MKRQRPLFSRMCGETEPHTAHLYVKRWKLVDLPYLREPERYPAEWDATYKCHGIKLPGKTWAESLGLDIPDDAPGGQRLASVGFSLPAGSNQNSTQIDYEGIYDTDAHRRSNG